jgi:hypothetical protein
MNSALASTRARRSGSRLMISSAARAAATDAGGRLAENMCERVMCLRKSIVRALPATKPPTEANDLENVPITMST